MEEENMAQEFFILDVILWTSLYLIVTLSLNIEYGYAGIPNFGRALAVLMGAIAAGGVVNRILIAIFGVEGDIIEASGALKSVVNPMIAQNPFFGLAIFVLSLIIAALVGALTGALFILPSAKLRHDYLAITLLAISEVIFMVSNYNPAIIGGYYGVSVPDILAWLPGELRFLAFTVVALITAILVYLFVERLLTSPYGRLLKAMRENEDVVEAFGKNIMTIRVKTVAIGSAVAAIAGALYSFYSVNVIATTFNRVEWTFFPFLMLLLGGMGNNRGVALGVFSFVLAKQFLTVYKFEIKTMLNLPFEATWLEYILFGIAMLLILYYRPEGILREKPVMTPPLKRALKEKKSHS